MTAIAPGPPLPAAAASRLRIRRLDLHCTVPAEAAGRAGLRGRLERLIRTRLPDALSEALAPLDQSGDGALLLRRLELELDLDPSLSDEAIASHWASALRAALLRALAGRDGGTDGLAWFPDRTRWLARFVVDLAAGRAWEGWLHRDFEGLKVLPVSAGLRTALASPGADGAGALLALEPAELVQVLSALTPGDARLLLAALAGAADSPATPSHVAVAVLAQALAGDAPARRLAEAEPARGALALWLAGLRAAPAAGSGLAPLALAAATLAHRIMRPDGAALPGLIGAGDWGAIAAEHGPETVLALRPLVRAGAAARLSEALLVAPRPAQCVPGEARWTPFGNALLLLPVIAELPLRALADALVLAREARFTDAEIAAEATPKGGEGAPGQGGAESTSEALLRWAVLARCQGVERGRACLRDPLVAELCGVAPRTMVSHLDHWLDALTPSGIAAARAALVAWIDPQPDRLVRVATVPRGAEPPADGEPPATGAPSPARPVVAIDTVLLETVRGCWLELLGTEGDAAAPLPVRAPSPVVDADLALLIGTPHRPADRLLAQLAQVVLKRFCYRLPGFADSSVGYLHRSFLGMDARLTVREERVEAVLGPVPLTLVLTMTGADRRTLTLPWLPLPILLRRETG